MILCLAPLVAPEGKVLSLAAPAAEQTHEARMGGGAGERPRMAPPLPEPAGAGARFNVDPDEPSDIVRQTAAAELTADGEQHIPTKPNAPTAKPAAITEAPAVISGRMVELTSPRNPVARQEPPGVVHSATGPTEPESNPTPARTPVRTDSSNATWRAVERKLEPARAEMLDAQGEGEAAVEKEPALLAHARRTEPADVQPVRRNLESGDERESSGDRPHEQHETGVGRVPVQTGTATMGKQQAETAKRPEAARPLVPAAAAETPEVAGPKPALRDIAVRVRGEAGSSVDLQFVESRGGVNLTVRTADERIASALQNVLPSLENDLESKGWRAELRPAAALPATELRETLRTAESIAADRQSFRWSGTSVIRTEEAGMQSGEGGDPRHGAREMTEEQEEFRSLTALRRLAAMGERA